MKIGYVLIPLPLNEAPKVRRFAHNISDLIKKPGSRVTVSPALRSLSGISTLTLKVTVAVPGNLDTVIGKEAVPLARVMNERKLTGITFSHGAKEEDIFELLCALSINDLLFDHNNFKRTGIELNFFRPDLEARIIPAVKLTAPPAPSVPLPSPLPSPIPSPVPTPAPKFVEKPPVVPITEVVSNGKRLSRQALRTSVAQAKPEIEAWIPEAKQRIEDYIDEKKECVWSKELVARSTQVQILAEQLAKLQKMLGLDPSEYSIPRYEGTTENALGKLKANNYWERKIIERPETNLFADRDLFEVFSRCAAVKLRLQTNHIQDWKLDQLQELKDLTEWLDYLLFKNGENLPQEYAQWSKMNKKAQAENLAILLEHFRIFSRSR